MATTTEPPPRLRAALADVDRDLAQHLHAVDRLRALRADLWRQMLDAGVSAAGVGRLSRVSASAVAFATGRYQRAGRTPRKDHD